MISTRDLQTSSWHQVIIDTIIRVITSMSWLHLGPLFVIQLLHLLIITAWVVYRLKTWCGPQAGCFGGLQGRLLQDQRQSWKPVVVAWSRGVPQTLQQKLDKAESALIASKTTGGATSEVVREDGWPDAAWPDPSGRQRQLQTWTTIRVTASGKKV